MSENPFTKLYPASEWKPEMEDVIWWHLPIVRSPYIGCPKLENWPYDIKDADLYFSFPPAVWDDPRNKELILRAGKRILEKHGEQALPEK
jgi:hypothetical protein